MIILCSDLQVVDDLISLAIVLFNCLIIFAIWTPDLVYISIHSFNSLFTEYWKLCNARF